MIEALVLDFDGTILETETPDYRSWQETFESFGVSLEPSLWASYVGGASGGFDAVGHLAALSGGTVDREAVRLERRRRYLELVEAEPLRPGVLAIIGSAERLGLRLGVASSATRNWVVGHLERRGLMGRFGSVWCGDDVSAVKPDPEVYLAVTEELGVVPHRALAIEDSARGVASAKSAGLFCVAVPNPITAGMDFSGADAVYPTLEGVSLEAIVGLLDSR